MNLGGRPCGTSLPLVLIVACALNLFSGCDSSNQLETWYGSSTPLRGDTSVNGLGVFSQMFSAAGHDVASTTILSPRAEELADVIVWAPRDFGRPSQDAVDWIENWLAQGPDRTLIYIHRDYDAGPAYWREVGPTAPANVQNEVKRQTTLASNDFLGRRASLPVGQTDFTWFTATGGSKPRTVTSLQGRPEWTSAIDATKLEIELIGDIKPAPGGSAALSSGAGEPLVIQEQWLGRQVLVLANGSFVLNYPLINPEHRKLAGKVVDSVGEDRYVLFLDATSSPTVSDEDPVTKVPSAFAYLFVPPINYALLHLILFGLILCFARYPIFGIPREDAPDDLSDFGQHIEALGSLLAKTDNEAYAIERLRAYRALVRGDHAAARNLSYATSNEAKRTETTSSPGNSPEGLSTDE
ncbi:MAG: hypothetical protein MPJ50_10890 [Pirellulales bacterium]|nr:hypothetical protein [Pirellulales bacterium]